MRATKFRAVGLAAALLGMPAASAAQEGQCVRGMKVPDLGFDSFECRNCNISIDNGYRDYRFGSEPVLVSEIGPVLSAHTGPGLLGVGSIPRHFLD